MSFKTIYYDKKKERLKLIDQRKLPGEKKYFEASEYKEVKYAISNMVVRGAPAIGAAGAYGVFLAAKEYSDFNRDRFLSRMKEAINDLKQARPTAVNLNWAVERMKKVICDSRDLKVCEITSRLLYEADNISKEDIETNHAMAKYGNKIVPEKANIVHHCNTGALAAVDYGTALGVIREAHKSGKKIHVYVDETRPRLQGARLTGFELLEEEIPATLIVDSSVPTLMSKGRVDLVLVGADRVAANGDVANKIGTLMLALAADRYDIPFYVAAPTSTIDFETFSGSEITIEERSAEEVKSIQGVKIAPEEINVYNPAFDITPAELISGLITERGILKPPLQKSIGNLRKNTSKSDREN